MQVIERNLSLSHYTFEEMCLKIPGGVNSPARAFLNVKTAPLIAAEGKGDILIDIDGNEYIDFCNSWGALILGHQDPQVVAAILNQLQKGLTFGVTTAQEGVLARKITDLMPHIEKIRFVSTGTEACMSAIRLARGYSGKNKIVKFSGNYHGHVDALLVKAGSGLFQGSVASSSLGIPQGVIENTICLPYNNEECLEDLFANPQLQNDIAAVILEPIAGNMGVVKAQEGFIKKLRNLTASFGTLLIFDEVMCGFRVSLQGASEILGVTPDLTCLGKIIGGGLPAAAFGGKKEIMDLLAPLGPVYQAGTLSGNPLAMQAGLATLIRLEKPGFYEEIERKACLLLDPIRKKLKEKEGVGSIQQVGGMFTLFFGASSFTCAEESYKLHEKQFVDYFQYLLERGIYMPQSQYEAAFISMAHTDEHLIYTANTINEYLDHVFKSY